MLEWPTLLGPSVDDASCGTTQNVRVPGLAVVCRTGETGFFKASGSQSDGAINPSAIGFPVLSFPLGFGRVGPIFPCHYPTPHPLWNGNICSMSLNTGGM